MAKSVSGFRNSSKTVKSPARPFEKDRLMKELELCGKYGLRCKREVHRVQTQLEKVRQLARDLLKEDESSPKRQFEGAALLRRLHRLGVLSEDKNKLDYILSLTIEDFMERRLQTVIYHKNLAKSVHHARVLIRQGHIAVGGQVVDNPSFMVRSESEPQLEFSIKSSLREGNKPGRIARKKSASHSEE